MRPSLPVCFKTGFLAATTLITGLTLSGLTHANNPPPAIKVEAPNVYVVKKGDTLWDISGQYLSEPWRWPEIYRTNPQIRNPNLIYPGDRLILCIIKGERLIGIDDGEGCAGLEARMTGQKAAIARYEPLSSAISAIPLSDIKSFLYFAQVVDPVALKGTPYILASKSGSIITGAGNTVYARGAKLILGEDYGIYRAGDFYFDPDTGKTLGQEVQQIGKALAVSTSGKDITTLEITQSMREEVREGDRVFIDLDDAYQPIFYPNAASANLSGEVLKVLGSLGSATANSVVSVDMGRLDGAKAGDVFTIYRDGATVLDRRAQGELVELPSERSGMLMIFKTFDKVSYAYVLEADEIVRPGDQLLSPLAF